MCSSMVSACIAGVCGERLGSLLKMAAERPQSHAACHQTFAHPMPTLPVLAVQNVLHGDLTGNNIMLITDKTQRKGFSCKVADFGLSRLIGEGASMLCCSDAGRFGSETRMYMNNAMPEHFSCQCKA